MKDFNSRGTMEGSTRSFTRLALALGIFVGVVAGCDNPKETAQNFNSRAQCNQYCDKKYDCADRVPSDSEGDACVVACRDAIEDNCGNDNQSDANSKIGDCVDLGCVDFWACMTFDAAPECFAFVSQD